MKKQIVLATQNKHKIKEIADILGDLENIEILDLSSFPPMDPVIEDGLTLEANAIIKAKAVFEHTKVLSLADDTGLMVDYLLGAPGVFSSRYAGENVSYADNNKKLLQELKGIPPRKRGARFKCCIALYDGNTIHTFEGAVEGKILTEVHGTAGFGYDPLFLPNDYSLTYAELGDTEKNKISHRYNALFLTKDYLKGI
jgi:XTP/dITP diphosphohydrolase